MSVPRLRRGREKMVYITEVCVNLLNNEELQKMMNKPYEKVVHFNQN